MKGEKHTRCGAVLGRECEQVLALVQHPTTYLVIFATGEHLSERALARAVRPHNRVHLAGVNFEIHTLKDLVAANAGVKVHDL